MIDTATTLAEDNHNSSPKLRILYITHYSSMFGANFALYHLMQDMAARHNIIPSVLAPKEGDFSRICRQNNIEVFCSKFYGWQNGITPAKRVKGLVKYAINQAVYYRKILSLLKDKSFDIIHTNSSITDIGSFIAGHHSIPHVWHVREFMLSHYNCDYVMPLRFVRAKYANSSRVIAISQAMYNNMVNERMLSPASKTRMIYDGLAIPEAYTKHDSGDTVHFCITGLLHPGKNQITAIQASAKLKAFTNNFMLHIIGAGSKQYSQKLNQLVESSNIEENVKFWGYRSDVDEILHSMDVGLMLSTSEAFGRVTVEYMLNYMPVIGVDSGATPEIVVDGETGYIVPLNDSDRIAQLMHKFITQPELIRSMGNKGRERAVKNFSLERNTDEIYALYREIH